MIEEFKIVYQHYIPDDLISDFKKTGLNEKLDIELVLEKEEQKYYNFTSSEIADIVIYIHQHTTELLVGGLLLSATYDLLKAGLTLLWTGLSKLTIKKLKSGDKETFKPKCISVRLVGKERAVEIVLDGDVNEEKADKIIDESFKYINSERINEDFNNPDFIPNNNAEKPRIRLKYNKEKQIWEPEDFGKLRI